MEKTKTVTLELALFLGAILLGLGLRLASLGTAPLSDYEAGWALQALSLARGEQLPINALPVYVLPTAFLFFVFESTNFLARFLPALAGVLLLLLPFFFRFTLGRSIALIMAFGLAFDPGLVSLSRLAGGPMLAAAFGLLSIGAIFSNRWILAGILGGLALLSGPAILHGLLTLFLAYLAGLVMVKAGLLEHLGYLITDSSNRQLSIRKSLAWLTGTVLLVGTLFGLFPQGLGAMAGALPAYLAGWGQPSDVPALRLAASLLFYQPLALIFGILGIVRVWREDYGRFTLPRWLSLWVVVALLAVMLYPARQVGDLVWVLVPLWGLAAVELSHYLVPSVFPQDRIISISQAVFLVVLMSFAWINLAALGNIPGIPVETQWRNALLLISGALAMGILTTLLVALGWSWTASRQGFAWGIALASGIYLLSTLWGSAYLRPNRAVEFWSPSPGTGQAGLLLSTLESLSTWQTGHERKIEVAVLGNQPSLQWALRSWPEASFPSGLGAGRLPAAIISAEEDAGPSLAAAYRGQSFIWTESPDWPGVLPENWPRWLVARNAPVQETRVILWARSDLFPGGVVEPDINFINDLPVVPVNPELDMEK